MSLDRFVKLVNCIMRQNLRVDASRVLHTVPFENDFHFRTDQGDYTNVTATSLMDFADKLDVVNIVSVEFHLSPRKLSSFG
jgi:hypothetical protein